MARATPGDIEAAHGATTIEGHVANDVNPALPIILRQGAGF